MPSVYHVAWWNVENLFDEEGSPRRTDKVARALGHDIVGWTPALRDQKITQLASVIAHEVRALTDVVRSHHLGAIWCHVIGAA